MGQVVSPIFGESDNGVLRLHSGRVVDRSVIQNARLHRVSIRDVRFRADVEISNCKIDVLEISDVGFLKKSSLVIDGCDIARLVIRSLKGSELLSIDDVRAGSIVLHEVGATSITATTIDGMLRISRPAGHLGIVDSSCDQLQVKDMGNQLMEIEISRSTIRRDAKFLSGEISRFSLTDVLADSIVIRDAIFGGDTTAVSLNSCSVESDVVIQMAKNGAHPMLEVNNSRIGFALDLRSLQSESSSCVILRDSSVLGPIRARDFQVSGRWFAIYGSSVGKALRIENLSELLNDNYRNPVLSVQDVDIQSIDLPDDRYRGKRQVHELANQIFGIVDIHSVGILRTSFRDQHRSLSEDASYALMQNLMTADSGKINWRRLIFGEVLGWGVQLWPPVRALALLVAITIGVFFTYSQTDSESFLHRAQLAIINSSSVWININSPYSHVIPDALQGWMAGLCGTLGMIIGTVIVGIIIRKLVR